MKLVIIVGFMFFIGVSFGQDIQNPFKELKYDSVVAYEFQGNGGRTIDVVLSTDHGRLDSSIILSSEQLLKFEDIITKKGAYGNGTAACFDPHFAVIYYLKDEVVAQIDICLQCNYLSSTIRIPSTEEVVYDEGTDYERYARGFAADTRKLLDEYIRSLGFIKYKMNPQSIFDK